MLSFQEITIEDKEMIDSYMLPFGEKSCQHSFQALYAMGKKYRTAVCCREDCLFVRQRAKDEGIYESCLMPMGGKDRGEALRILLEDVHSHKKKLKLQTITESAKEFLEARFPGIFAIEEYRNYSEYVYTTERLRDLPGSDMNGLRQNYNRYCRRYGSKAIIETIEETMLAEVMDYQEKWLAKRREDLDYPVLAAENEAIRRVCRHYGKLGFSGIAVRIDGEIRGYAMGCGISESTLDIFFEKGDREIRDIYRCLVTDMVRICGGRYDWVNREEDLGDAGMRRSKMSYRPNLLMKKYIAKEIIHE